MLFHSHSRHLIHAANGNKCIYPLIVNTGIDPIKERRRLKREALQSANTFEHLAYEAFEARKSELKGDGKNGRWFTPVSYTHLTLPTS